MQRFEYTVVDVDGKDSIRAALAEYARHGWRLAESTLTTGYTTGLVFERECARADETEAPDKRNHPRG